MSGREAARATTPRWPTTSVALRARACEQIRAQLPNLIAVDFYRRGDAFRVADTLNGL